MTIACAPNELINIADAIVAKRLLFATSVLTALGNHVVIEDPGVGKEIKIVNLQLQNENTDPITVIVKFDTVSKWRLLLPGYGDGLLINAYPGREWGVGESTPLLIELSDASLLGYSIAYFIDDVEV